MINLQKDVLVSINGMQIVDGDTDHTEVICPGMYYFKNEKHYITYEDAAVEGGKPVKNLLKISGDLSEPKVELIKQGGIGSHLIFEVDKNNLSAYETEYGSFMLGFHANKINVVHEEEEIDVKIEYSLEMNYEHISDNKIEIKVKSKTSDVALGLAE